MIDTVIFDVGNVLVRVENDYIRKDISKTLKVDLKLVETAWEHLIPNYLGKGKISEREFWIKFIEFTRSKVKRVPKNLLSRQLERRFTPNKRVINIVNNLRLNGYKLGIISDTIESHAEIPRKHGLFEPFDKIILSYQVGFRKPNPKIFRLALKELKSKPQKTVFIDDIRVYVESANKIGINGIEFKNTKQLKLSLNKLKVDCTSRPEKEETNVGAHALLITPDGNIVLQKRTSHPRIINPGKISMFGGTIRKNEKAIDGLRRELIEELGYQTEEENIKKLKTYTKTKQLDGIDYTIHVFLIRHVHPEKLALREGQGFVFGKVRELLKNKKLTRITRLALKDFSNSTQG